MGKIDDDDVDIDYKDVNDISDFDVAVFDDRDTDPYRMGSYYFYKADKTNH